AAVAAPLAPLNLSQTGEQGPITAASAAGAAVSGHPRQAGNSGRSPLARSRNGTAGAGPLRPRRRTGGAPGVPRAGERASPAPAPPLLPVRSTLAAPMLPEPMERMSPFPAAFASSSPNGIEPSA